MMGKIVRWSKRRGWEIGLTPYQHRIAGIHLFQRLRFKGLRPKWAMFRRRATRQVASQQTTNQLDA